MSYPRNWSPNQTQSEASEIWYKKHLEIYISFSGLPRFATSDTYLLTMCTLKKKKRGTCRWSHPVTSVTGYHQTPHSTQKPTRQVQPTLKLWKHKRTSLQTFSKEHHSPTPLTSSLLISVHHTLAGIPITWSSSVFLNPTSMSHQMPVPQDLFYSLASFQFPPLST